MTTKNKLTLKVHVESKSRERLPYPKLVISKSLWEGADKLILIADRTNDAQTFSGRIVKRLGVDIDQNNYYKGDFEDFEGEIIISNKI